MPRIHVVPLVCVAVVALTACRATMSVDDRDDASDGIDVVLRPLLDETFLGLLAPDSLAPGWQLDSVRVARDAVVYTLRSGSRVVEMTLRHPGVPGTLYSDHFSIRWQPRQDAGAQDAEEVGALAASSVIANDWNDVWSVLIARRALVEDSPDSATDGRMTVPDRLLAFALAFVFPMASVLIVLAGIARGGADLWRSERRRRLLTVALVAMGVTAFLQSFVDPFLGDIKVNVIPSPYAPGVGRFSAVWQSVLLLVPEPWNLHQVAGVNRIATILLILPMLSLLDRLFEETGAAAAGILGLASSVTLVMFSASTTQFVLSLFMLVATAAHLVQWQKRGNGRDLLATAASAACVIDLRPDGAFGLAVVALLPFALGVRPRLPRPGTAAAAAVLFLALAALSLPGTLGEIGQGTAGDWVNRNPVAYLAFPIFAFSELLTLVPAVLGMGLFVSWIVLRREIPHNRALLWLFLASAATSLGHFYIVAITNHRYALVAIAFRSVLFGALVHVLAARMSRDLPGRIARLLPAAATAAVLGIQLFAQFDALRTTWPHAAEFAFLAENLEALDNEERLVAQIDDTAAREAGLILPGAALSQLLGKTHEWLGFSEADRLSFLGDGYLHLGTGCWYALQTDEAQWPPDEWPDGNPDCRAVVTDLQRFADLQLLRRVWVPGVSYCGAIPTRPLIPLSWYRVRLRR